MTEGQQPTLEELRQLCLWPSGGVQEFPSRPLDEVWPGLFVGDAAAASDPARLRRDGFVAVLNAAHGKDPALCLEEPCPEAAYSEHGVAFLGLGALDLTAYPLERHFGEASRFLRAHLGRGRALVHCQKGVSRSAALAVAYLVLAEGVGVREALRAVRRGREVLPNDGFLEQLCRLRPGSLGEPASREPTPASAGSV